jgi:hypothetical protein
MPSAPHRSNGKFEEVGDQAGADFLSIAAHRGVAFGDIDNDGRMDAVVTTLRGQVKPLATSPTPGITGSCFTSLDRAATEWESARISA